MIPDNCNLLRYPQLYSEHHHGEITTVMTEERDAIAREILYRSFCQACHKCAGKIAREFNVVRVFGDDNIQSEP